MDKLKELFKKVLEPGFELTLTKQQRKIVVALIPIIFGLMAISILALKMNTPYSVKCPIYETTGFYCATCGLTRQVVALIEGNIYQAFRYNIITFIICLPTIIIYIIQSIKFVKNNSLSEKIDIILYTYLVVLILFMILRNTEKFGWLAPTEIINKL